MSLFSRFTSRPVAFVLPVFALAFPLVACEFGDTSKITVPVDASPEASGEAAAAGDAAPEDAGSHEASEPADAADGG